MRGLNNTIVSFLVMSLLFMFMFFPCRAQAEKGDLSEEEQICLGCHHDKGLSKTLESKETLSVFVDSKQLKSSIHTHLTCSDCHTDFSINNHPSRTFKSKAEYTLKASQTCKRCHAEKQIKAIPVHLSMLKTGKSPVCVDCHGSHAVNRISGGKSLADEIQYCLSCHKHTLSMKFKDGDVLPFAVNSLHLQGSVHGKHACSDCHLGFSTEHHQQRMFKSRRAYTIAASDICRRCHFDKYTQTLESIHFPLLSQGDLRAPVCIDCHGSHAILSGRMEKMASGKKCEKCHSEIYNIYAKSVHGKALVDEHITDVPICVDCHNAHNIEDPRSFEHQKKIPDICGSCHGNSEIMSKYGLSTAVVKTYLQDFHGITLKFYKQQKDSAVNTAIRPIAVCTDCHGIHDITKTTGPNANTIKANLVKRCQKCHPGATENFPNAWVSHYEPSLKKAPLVFIINLIYKFFIPFMITGLLLQIFLHIWRYAVNR
jgi:hypothetical protein